MAGNLLRSRHYENYSNLTQRFFRKESVWNTPVPGGVTTTAIGTTSGVFWLDPWNSPGALPTAWTNHTFALNEQCSNASNAYICTTPGASTAAPTGTGTNINNGGTAVFSYEKPRAGISCPVYIASYSDPKQQVWFSPGNFTFVNSNGFVRWGNTAANETTIKGQWVNTFGYATNTTPYIARYQSTTQNGTGSSWTAPTASFNHRADASSLPRTIYVPANTYPAAGTDGFCCIVQPDGTIFECIQWIQLTTGEVTCFDYSLTFPHDYGDGWQNGACTSMVPVYAGAITGRDIANSAIDHALHLTLTPDNLSSASIAYPALTFDKDGGVAGGGQYTGGCPMGSRLVIPAATNINGHTWGSTGGPIVAQALQTYGGFVLDRSGGTGSCQIAVEATYDGNYGLHGSNWTTWSAAFEADLLFIWQNWLVRVTNAIPNPRP